MVWAPFAARLKHGLNTDLNTDLDTENLPQFSTDRIRARTATSRETTTLVAAKPGGLPGAASVESAGVGAE